MSDKPEPVIAWTVRVHIPDTASVYAAEGYGRTPEAALEYLHKRIDERLGEWQKLKDAAPDA